MRIYTIFLIIFCFSINSLASQKITKNNFKHCVEITGPVKRNNLYQVHIDDKLLQKSSSGGIDIRIFDKDNTEIPYVILKNITPSQGTKIFNFKILSFEEDENASTILIKSQQQSEKIDYINLSTSNRDFRRNVSVEGSNDKNNWEKITDAQIYDLTSQVDLRKTSIEVNGSNYLYYRIKIINPPPVSQEKGSINLHYEGLDFNFNTLDMPQKLRIDNITGYFNQNSKTQIIYDNHRYTTFDVKLDEKQNSIIDLKASLPFDKVYFEITNPYYFRKIQLFSSTTDTNFIPISKDLIYNFPLADQKNQIEKKNYIIHSSENKNFYRFIIENKNNPPIDIKSITFEWIERDLYFIGLNDEPVYFLCTGNDELNEPDYEINSFIRQENWFEQSFKKLQINKMQKNIHYIPPVKARSAKIQSYILTAIIIGLVIGLGYWILILIRKTNSKKS